MNLLDLSNMKNLKDIYKDGNVRKTIDLRGCFNLESFWHTNNGEIVCIFSGMTKYIGCKNIVKHIGIVIINLNGFYSVDNQWNKKLI